MPSCSAAGCWSGSSGRCSDRRAREEICRARIARAKTMLAGTMQPILDVSLASGFPSALKFSAVFKRETGMSPAALPPAIPDRPRRPAPPGRVNDQPAQTHA